jgi:hypothetical protein
MATSAYRPQSIDTSVEADRFAFRLLRERSNSDRLATSAALSRGARELSLMGLQRTFSELSPAEFAQKVAYIWLGHQWPTGFVPKGEPMTWIQDSLQLARALHPIFTQANIPYYIIGGVAATAYGDPRTTRDLDVVLNISRPDIPDLVTALEAIGFYVPGIEDIRSGRMNTLQIIHQESVLQADLVIAETNAWEAVKFERRLLEGGLYFISPEDIVLSKLQWRTTSQSEKQWRDVLGILKVQGEYLNFEYLREWANSLSMSEDLDRTCREAGFL